MRTVASWALVVPYVLILVVFVALWVALLPITITVTIVQSALSTVVKALLNIGEDW